MNEQNLASKLSGQKILLVGGSGFIGGSVLRKLTNQNCEISVLSRKERNTEKNVKYIKADLLDPESLKKALDDKYDILIQSVQFSGHPVERPWLGKSHTYEGFDAQGTENLIKAISESKAKNSLKQYIYLSGAGADLDIDYPWTRAKKRAEKAIRESGVSFTIFRPSWVYGKGDQSMSKFVLFAKYLPFFPVIGNGKAPVNPLWVEDLSQIIVNSILHPQALNQTINVGSLPELNMKQVSQIVLDYVGNRNKPIICHPKPLMKLAGVFAQFIPISPLSPNSVEFLTMDVHLKDLKKKVFDVQINGLQDGLEKSGLK
ncbi:MAG: NAD(P)H-binding protein [Candidatus Caenarcaniphilales bacterium]|nr:NAD(P)H-binding protein [Candidatus Caenarcaniphilales bacterium]